MKLSYIVPVYNIEKYIAECVNSILSQTFSDYEIILVDDGSTDTSGAICDNYAAEHENIIVIHKENAGLAAARNTGFAVAKGEYIWFFDGDDYLIDDKAAELFNIVKENNLDILQTSYFVSTNNEKFEPKFKLNQLYTKKDLRDELYHANMNRNLIFVWRNVYKRDFLVKNHIKFTEELRRVEDGVFDAQCFTICERFMAVDIPAYCYRIRENSLQKTKYVKDYDLILQMQWKLKNKFFEEAYGIGTPYDIDCAEFTIKALLPIMLGNEYKNKTKDRYKILKRIATCEMMKKSFSDYDINLFRSKSLDWLMTWFLKHRLYYPAHLICEYIL